MNLQIEHITESKFNEFRLFFSFIEEQNELSLIRFVGRHWDGAALHKGFTILIPMFENWAAFQKNVLENPDFIECLFNTYRFGFTFIKLWDRIVDFFGAAYEDCPFKEETTQAGKDRIKYRELIEMQVGKINAHWTNGEIK